MNEGLGIAAVVLAAGASKRLGRPKQTVEIGGETLLARAVRVAGEAGLAPVMVVIRPEGDFGHSLQQQGCVVVLNDGAAEGIASSIRCGIRAARALKAQGVVLMTCDQVAVTPQYLRALCSKKGTPAGSGYAGKVGIPAYFPASSFDGLLALHGDSGARDLLREARAVATEDLSFDVDTEEDVALAERFLTGQRPL